MTSPASVGGSYAATVFTSTGLSLAAGSRYWAVCRASDDDNYDWGFTYSNTGSGVGFVVAQSESLDFGVTWSSADGDPFLMRVEADVIAVPEPSQWGLLGATFAGAAGVLIRQRRARAAVR